MSVLIVLVIISIIVAVCFLAAFIWSVKTGQYDDSYTPSVRMLLEEGTEKKNNKPIQNQSHQNHGQPIS
jgi:cbb3-type cytochrome oxidase maturation protein